MKASEAFKRQYAKYYEDDEIEQKWREIKEFRKFVAQRIIAVNCQTIEEQERMHILLSECTGFKLQLEERENVKH